MKEVAVVVDPFNVVVDHSPSKLYITLSALTGLKQWEVEQALAPLLEEAKKYGDEKAFFRKARAVLKASGADVKESIIEKALLSTVGSPIEEGLEDYKAEWKKGELFLAVAASTVPSIWERVAKLLPGSDLTLLSYNINFTDKEDLYYAFIYNTLSYHGISKVMYVSSSKENVEKAQANGLNAFLYVKGKRLSDYFAIAHNIS